MEAQREVHGDSRRETAGDVSEGPDPVNKMRIGDVRRRVKGIPIKCDCGVAIALEISQSPNTPGEKFFRCGYDVYGGGDGCGFRMWLEDAMFEEFEKVNEDKMILHQRLDEATKRIDKQDGRIYELQMQYEEVMSDMKQLDDYDGELCGTQLVLEEMRDKDSSLERRVELLELKFEKLNN